MHQHPPSRVNLTVPALREVSEFAFSYICCRDCLIASANSTLLQATGYVAVDGVAL